jgi:NADH:quinone reductase (non-electrogenic)
VTGASDSPAPGARGSAHRTRRVVILGGGFGGAYTAMHLERQLKSRVRRRGAGDIEIALVSHENYLVFQPLIPEVVSSSIGIVDTIAPLRRLCPRTRLYTRSVQSVDLAARTVTLAPGFQPRPLVLEYDHLVVALGNVTGLAGLPGGQQHVLPFKSLGDALYLRNHVIHVLEEAEIEADPEVRKGLTTFVVAGGGFSGVEIAAELNDFVREVVEDYPDIDPQDLKVLLLHSRDRILPELSEQLGRFAERVLRKRGVDIRLGCRLAGATASAAILNSGERIPSRTIVSTVPAVPHPLVAGLPVPRERDRLVVNETLAVPQASGVWAVGDCAAVRDPKTHELVPTTAQHAIREAECVADNIVASLDGGPLRTFGFSGLGQLASLGRHSAVAQVFGVKLSGLAAWFLWRTIYLMKLPGLDRKLRVATDWALDLILRQDIVQLKTDRTQAIGYEHFDAGEYVVRQGDVGDKLYIIKKGEVEVLKARAGASDERVAVLKGGDSFGEMALLTGAPRTATVRSMTPLDVMVVGREDFLALIGSFPELRAIFEELGRKRE